MGVAQRCRVLLIEDEMTIALMIEDMLVDLGHDVVGTATSPEAALALARTGNADLAIMDVDLNGRPSHAIAQVLANRHIPFIVTRYGSGPAPDMGSAAATLTKPFQMADLVRTIAAAAG